MVNFLKKNWGWFIVIIVILFGQKFLSNSSVIQTFTNNSTYNGFSNLSDSSSSTLKIASTSRNSSSVETASDRMVIENTSLSLRVDDVETSINNIKKTTQDLSGFLINSNISKPEEAASGSISVRVPKDKKTEAIDAFKKMANKVVSENVISDDITDEYQDLDARLEVLTKTKTKYEEILNKAEKVSDILEVQQQLTNLQIQIDSVKGQQKYYDQSVDLTKITLYLSTDEIALPYTPTNTWQPKAIFKQATRSLVETFRSIGSFLIWAVVYIPIILPIYVIIRIVKKRKLLKAQKI